MPCQRQREAPPSALPGISPARGEIFRLRRLVLSFNIARKGEASPLSISPLVGELAASQRGYTGSEGDSDRHGSGAPPPPRSAGRDPVLMEDGARIMAEVLGAGMEIVAKGRNDGGRGEICHRFRAGVVLMHPA